MQVYPLLAVLCRRFFDDEQDVITALNNGMLRVFKNIGMYDPVKAELSTWIYTIVRNEALTHIRNKKSELITTEITPELATETIANPLEEPDKESIVAHVQKLPCTTRVV